MFKFSNAITQIHNSLFKLCYYMILHYLVHKNIMEALSQTTKLVQQLISKKSEP